MGGAVEGPSLRPIIISLQRGCSGLGGGGGGGLCPDARIKHELGWGYAGHTLTLIPGKVTAEEA